MDQYDIAYAREHLDELIKRAESGEAITITDPERGAFTLARALATPRKPRRLGLLEGKVGVPDDLLEPMSEGELAVWYDGKP